MLFSNKEFYKTTRFKTTVWYACLFLILEIVSGLIIYFYLSRGLYKDLDEAISKQAQTIYRFVSESNTKLLEFKPDSIYSSQEDFIFDLIFEAVVLNPRSSFIQVKLNNVLLFQTENLNRHEIILPENRTDKLTLVTFKDSFLSDSKIRAAHLAENKYEIIVAYPVELIAKTLDQLINLNIIIIPIFLLLAVAGGAIISARSLSRIDSIINKTNDITAHNLSEKIAGEEYDDEYGRLTRTMNEMISRIKTSIEYMNQFSVAASHELKTPLTILRGEIEVALKSPKSNEEYREILQSNYEETLRLTNIVEKLFLLSKLDNSLVQLKKEPINISELITPIIEQSKTLVKEKNLEIKFYVKTDFKIVVDRGLMRGAIENIVMNALKYCEENSVVTISALIHDANQASIFINNKGRAIPKEIHEKIFDRFFRSETSRDREPGGIGLGLAIAKSIVQFHNGKIWVESEPDKGTTFGISIDFMET